MFDICPEAQQAVVSALNAQHLQEQKVILCHSPGQIQATGFCNLGTHDLFRELVEDKREDFVSVFPNIQSVVNSMRRMQSNGFAFEVVLSCHEKSDLISLLAELIEKFAGAHKFIHSVKSLCRLPEKTLKPHPTLTYFVGLQSDRCSHIDIHWNGELKKSDLSFPKSMFALDPIQEILGKKSKLLSSFRAGRNGCASYDGSNNSKTIAYDAYKRSHSHYSKDFEELIQVLFQEAKSIPLAVVQVKKAINWELIRGGNQVSFTMLCLRHLEDTEQSQFACFLTRQKILFYFPKRNVIWIDLRGVDSNILVKLMNYAEVPIPTSNKQGGYSVSLQGANVLSSSHTFHLECQIGRIGAISVIPVQVDIEEVQSLVAEPIEGTALAKVLCEKYRAYNFQIVRALNEEGNSGDMIQFLVPQRFESYFPCQCVVKNVTFAIDHALPYSPPLSVPSRPPTEETRHDHWNKAACLRQTGKKGRRNQIVAKKGCPGSINRAHCLQEGIIQGKSGKINTSFEFHHFPLLFVAGDVTIEAALEQLVAYMPSSYLKEHIESAAIKLDDPRVPAVEHRSEVPVLYILEVEGDGARCLNVGCVIKANERLTISNAEILQCHTFTKCLLCTVVPPGFTIGDLCTPPESYRVHSFHSLGIVANKHDLSNASQAYAVGSAAGPTLAEDKSNIVGTTNSIPTSAVGHKRPGEGAGDEQVTTTLSWTSKSAEEILTPEHNGQQPIVPTQKKGLASIKPSSKENASAIIQKATQVENDQDVEMADADSDQRSHPASQSAKPTPSLDDPIESYGSSKRGNDNMEIDSEGTGLHQANGRQAMLARRVETKKPTREAIAAIASPQKSDRSKNSQECPEKQPLASLKNNSKSSRPPGITVFQHASILLKDREKKENQATKGQEPRQVSRSGKRLAKNKHHANKVKGVTNTGVSLLLQKAIDTPIQSQTKEHDELDHESPKEEVIDLEQEDLARALAAENVLKQSIHEANIKWHTDEDAEFRDTAGKYALEFLKSMNGTLCYLMVALRMLAKASWTAKMVCVHVRQAAIYAISKGWYVNTSNSHGVQFSRAELALAAGTFLGDLRPNLPDDPDQPMFLLIHLLPSTCADLFSSGTAVCPSCGQSKTVPVPTFASAISWSSPTWVNLRLCIEHHCTPFPWISDPDDVTWHDDTCNRHDTDVIDIQIGPWAYVSLRGNELERFPRYSTVTEILQDTSLESKGFVIQAFVCCNIHDVKARHFWLLEVQDGKPVWLFDSLGGLMPITLEVTKKLWITGFLLGKIRSDCPVLTSKALEEVAGKLGRKERISVPIAVPSRTTWLRKTQQQVTRATVKGKKTSTKRGSGGQKTTGQILYQNKRYC